jgi:hypothetical protein
LNALFVFLATGAEKESRNYATEKPYLGWKIFLSCSLLKDIDDDTILRKLSAEGLSKILDIGCRLERLNRDEPEHNVEVVQQQNFDRLTLDEVETLRTLHAKAEGKA